MTIRRWHVVTLVCLAVMGFGCDAASPTVPDSGVVTKWKDQGGSGWPINVCVKGDDGKEGCDNYRRNSVKNCHVGSQWPSCKEHT